MASNDPGGAKPPYGPWPTFENFIRGFNGSVVPPVIDGTLLRNLSGSARSQLVGALRYMGLITDDGNRVTDRLRALVSASGEKETWQAALSELIPSVYASITEGVDLDTATSGQLVGAFRERASINGSVLEKAVRFYLAAMTAAGHKLSPHFGAAAVNGSAGRKTGVRKALAQKKAPVVGEPEEETQAVGTEKITCSVPGGRTVTMSLPGDLAPEEEDFLVMYLQGYFKLRRKNGVPE